MRASAAAAGRRTPPRVWWSGWLLAALLLGAVVLIWWRPARAPVPAPAAAWPDTAATAAALARPPAADAVDAPGPPPGIAPGMAAPAAPATTPPERSDTPYRFIGRLAQDAGSALVLFGQGRVVVLQGPGPLDQAHVVEAVLDNALLLRHLPSGRGLLLPQEARAPVAWAVHDPETLDRD